MGHSNRDYTPTEMGKEAVKLFIDGFHCSQALFFVGARFQGVSAPDVIAAMAPFGGGMGSTGRVCGVLPGALAAIGLTMGKRDPADRDNKNLWRLSYKMVKKFEEITEQYGGVDCRDIARVDWRDRQQVKAFRQDPDSRRRECCRVIAAAAQALGELLETTKNDKR